MAFRRAGSSSLRSSFQAGVRKKLLVERPPTPPPLRGTVTEVTFRPSSRMAWDALVQAFVAHLDDGTEQSGAGAARFVGDEADFLVELAEVRDGLHEAAMFAHFLGDGAQFVAVGERAGDGAAVRQAMARQPVGGKAHRALLHRLPGEFGDLAHFVCAGGFFTARSPIT